MVLQAIKYVRGSLEILDQLRLPHEEEYIQVPSIEDAWHAIKSMQVRGAPAIAIVAVLSLAVALHNEAPISNDLAISRAASAASQRISKDLRYLVTSRPTAVNLADAARKLENLTANAAHRSGATSQSVVEAYTHGAEQMLLDDVKDNENIGSYGASWILEHVDKRRQDQKVSILTHCNTGSLATAGYGTALGVVRSLYTRGSLRHVYYTETRPYNQGSRLTGYELIHDGIPATLVTDSMAAALFRLKGQSENIAAVVVGADRVAANGDTANKIGTYALAILARFHDIKFLVAAPRTTVDLGTASGGDIIIEERSPSEVTSMKGPLLNGETNEAIHIAIAAKGTKAWNPAFDITPYDLIDGIVTDCGVVQKGADGKFKWSTAFDPQDLSVRTDHERENGQRSGCETKLAEDDLLEKNTSKYPGKYS